MPLQERNGQEERRHYPHPTRDPRFEAQFHEKVKGEASDKSAKNLIGKDMLNVRKICGWEEAQVPLGSECQMDEKVHQN